MTKHLQISVTAILNYGSFLQVNHKQSEENVSKTSLLSKALPQVNKYTLLTKDNVFIWGKKKSFIFQGKS